MNRKYTITLLCAVVGFLAYQVEQSESFLILAVFLLVLWFSSLSRTVHKLFVLVTRWQLRRIEREIGKHVVKAVYYRNQAARKKYDQLVSRRQWLSGNVPQSSAMGV